MEAVLGLHFNRDFERRDEMLGIQVEWGPSNRGGIAYFDNLNGDTLRVLIDEQFVAPDLGHNEAPTPKEFLRFLMDHPQATAGGYAVSPDRADYSVMLTSLHISRENRDDQLIGPVLHFCEAADELIIEPDMYCWWD